MAGATRTRSRTVLVTTSIPMVWKIHSTIDSRMQKYAEQAVREHLQYLQPQFTAESGQEICSLPNSVANDVERFMQTAMKQTDRYRILKTELE